jgi:glyoxylase-like metal-dependent hydrolase (beta-lactamase superfamily II)
MEILEVVPRLHLVRLEFGQAYLWRDGDELTLIDAGLAGSGPPIAEATRALGLDPTAIRRIVLTHGHEDHAGGAAEARAFDGAPVHVHHADAPVVTGASAMPPPVLTDADRELWAQVSALGLPPTPPCTVDVELSDGDELDFGDGAVVIGAPGHTPGSIGIHLPRHGILFTGDTVAAVPGVPAMLGVFNLDHDATVDAVRRFADLDPEVACFGHGDPVTKAAGEAMRAIPR